MTAATLTTGVTKKVLSYLTNLRNSVDNVVNVVIVEENMMSWKRDKSKNTPEFNKMAKKRRAKAKHDAKNRKKNRKK